MNLDQIIAELMDYRDQHGGEEEVVICGKYGDYYKIYEVYYDDEVMAPCIDQGEIL